MPSERIREKIERSLAYGEGFEDFAFMFDSLTRLRQPYQSSLEQSEEVTARLLCILVPDKPDKYRRAMQQFRLHFAKISFDPTIQAEFANSVRHAALVVARPEDIIWRLSLYFQYTGRDREEWY